MKNYKMIEGYDNYTISEEGIIKNINTGKIIKQYTDKNGYCSCKLNGKTKKVHRLVAMTFLLNENNLPIVDHINRARNDNRVENLRWANHLDNMQNKGNYKSSLYCDEYNTWFVILNNKIIGKYDNIDAACIAYKKGTI